MCLSLNILRNKLYWSFNSPNKVLYLSLIAFSHFSLSVVISKDIDSSFVFALLISNSSDDLFSSILVILFRMLSF